MNLDQVSVENVNHPGLVNSVNGPKYRDMADAVLRVMPSEGAGLTFKEIHLAIKPLLSPHMFPGGATSMWWLKTVQSDLEAKHILVRRLTKPARWLKA